jgi:hypothetical protein
MISVSLPAVAVASLFVLYKAYTMIWPSSPLKDLSGSPRGTRLWSHFRPSHPRLYVRAANAVDARL